jgi:hypothetical protein
MRLQLYRAVPAVIPHEIQESPKEGIHRSGSFGQLVPNTPFKMPINIHLPSLFICVYRTSRRLFLPSQFTKPSLNETFRMKYDQRVIIRFLQNEGADVHNNAQRIQTEFAQDAYALRTVQFWIGEAYRSHQDLHDEKCMGKHPLDGFDVKILAILDKSPFESA